MKELANIASLGGSSNPALEHRTAGGVAFTAGDVRPTVHGTIAAVEVAEAAATAATAATAAAVVVCL